MFYQQCCAESALIVYGPPKCAFQVNSMRQSANITHADSAYERLVAHPNRFQVWWLLV